MRQSERQKYSAVTIQSVWRAYTTRRENEIRVKCVVVIRSYAATTIQCVWRAFNARREYEALRKCVDMVQSHAATNIQSVWRAFSARGEYCARRKRVVPASVQEDSSLFLDGAAPCQEISLAGAIST
jgi:hypothetical protein